MVGLAATGGELMMTGVAGVAVSSFGIAGSTLISRTVAPRSSTFFADALIGLRRKRRATRS